MSTQKKESEQDKFKPEFKPGDKITLNTGFSCDKGTFLRWEGDKCIWYDKDGDIYRTPWTDYTITLQNHCTP